MADINPQAIQGQLVAPTNPLQIVSGWQDYANKVAQNAQIKQQTANAVLANQTGQQALAQTMAQRHNQVMFSLVNTPDAQLPGAAQDALDKERASGELDAQRYEVMQQKLHATGGDPAKIRAIITGGLISNLAGPEALAAMTPKITDTDIGGQRVARVTPSINAMLNGAPATVSTTGGAINNTLAPGYQNAGDTIVPVGGAYGQPAIGMGTSPSQANTLETLNDPVTGLPVVGRAAQQGGLIHSTVGGQPMGGQPGGGANVPGSVGSQVTGAAPPGGYRLPGAGAQTAQQGSPMGTGGPAKGGILSQGPVTNNPQAIQAQQDNYKNFRGALDAMPQLKTAEQTLLRAQQELQATPSGPGTDTLQRVRNYISSINGALGGKISENDIQAGSYDELGKDLAQITASAGMGAKFAGEVDAIQHGNPNLMMNRLANSNVLSLFLGQNRQQQLAVAMTKDQVSGRDYQTARQASQDLDPRALALDSMTKPMQLQTITEIKRDPAAYKKFMRTIGVAQKHGYYTAPAPGLSSFVPPENSGNNLQGQ